MRPSSNAAVREAYLGEPTELAVAAPAESAVATLVKEAATD
jgi:hypothetical protein